MDEEWQRVFEDRLRLASQVERQLLPGMTVDEAERMVASHPGLTLRHVDADEPVVTADFVAGRIDVYVRDGILVDPESIATQDDD